ncbi:M23 family metallopeptidase [Acetobacterium wieringae]|uniref:M23 family metallopeptidase n=1 Tax=Acetobacterium wieringae TaxID=52694 RepID=UPI0026F2151D|nr:peptidoglycan DD-metalloendopeptidase family protein [Acetobacterium wieringae]
MEKTQNFFEKVRARIKKYRFNWSTKQVEHDEFVEIEHVNHRETLNKNKKRLFKMRGSAVVVCTFFVLVGAGAVDAQTRAYEVIYKGTSIGYVDSLEVLEAAVQDTSANKSGRRNREGSDYEIRTARSTDFLTTEEVTQVITAIRTQDKNNEPEVLVARVDNPEPAAASPETSITDAETLQTASVETVEEEPILEPEITTASGAASHTSETPVNPEEEVAAVMTEVPVEDVPVIEAPMTEVVAEDIQLETPPADEVPAVDTPVLEEPANEAPAEENNTTASPVTEIPEEPVAEVPVVEAPAAETPAEELANETPQAQFMLPASGRVGEILRDYDGGYYSNHYRAAAVDILNSEGTAVYAAASGTVTLSSWYGGYGKCVIIDHGNGYSTLYGHFSSVDVVEGQTVSQGQRIGGMGSTGSSTANHVHFEVRVNDEAQPIGNYFNISTGDYI